MAVVVLSLGLGFSSCSILRLRLDKLKCRHDSGKCCQRAGLLWTILVASVRNDEVFDGVLHLNATQTVAFLAIRLMILLELSIPHSFPTFTAVLLEISGNVWPHFVVDGRRK